MQRHMTYMTKNTPNPYRVAENHNKPFLAVTPPPAPSNLSNARYFETFAVSHVYPRTH